MKVLKKQDVSNWTYKHNCVTCESELEVEPKDLSHHYYEGDIREHSAGYDTFTATCPVCNDSFQISENKIPKLIKIEAKKRSRPSGNYFDR